ncbi:MAG TPA: endonuclease/exonuclease/phosphatase family protein, partial [Chloroflexota bacterium]|nr:endonuclease/exonuclease/phosphatase family protein [Chloroflexota bacterium]
VISPILHGLAQGRDPLIVAGDLNLTDQTPDYRRLRSLGLQDAYRVSGWGFGFTFPAIPTQHVMHSLRHFPPFLRIDYVLHSKQITPLRAEVLTSAPGSDHHPVIADVLLPACAP